MSGGLRAAGDTAVAGGGLQGIIIALSSLVAALTGLIAAAVTLFKVLRSKDDGLDEDDAKQARLEGKTHAEHEHVERDDLIAALVAERVAGGASPELDSLIARLLTEQQRGRGRRPPAAD